MNITVTGIVAEYNPFHNGHKYQIEKAREVTGADIIIVVMSGDFTQRGTPAICDKYLRAQMALSNGADLVIELPACYACASAEYFALGAIALLDKLGVVDYVCFGSECGDITPLKEIASVLCQEPKAFKDKLNAALSQGKTFPTARNEALLHVLPSFAEHSEIIASPNNILGIEYIKSILKINSKITPVTIQRTGADYHAQKYTGTTFPSALSLRSAIDQESSLTFMKGLIPEDAYSLLSEHFSKSFPVFSNDFSNLLCYKLLSLEEYGFEKYADITSELSERIKNHLPVADSFENLCDKLKSKNVTYARISRILCHILLEITQNDIDDYIANGVVYYANILGFTAKGSELFGSLKENSSIPLLTRKTDGLKCKDPVAQKQYKQDLFASNLYETIVSLKYNCPLKNELQRQIIKI